MLSTIALWFAASSVKSAAANVFTAILNFATTAIGAALIAGSVMFTVGDIHGHRVVKTEWVAAEAAATAANERARLLRDAFVKAKIEADANERLATITAHASLLELKVTQYEALLAHAPFDRSCILSSDDERRLPNYNGSARSPRGRAYRLLPLTLHPASP
jgi:hypothetical protein